MLLVAIVKTGLWPIVILLLMGSTWGLQFAMLKLAVEEGYDEFGVLMLALVMIAIISGAVVAIRRRYFRLNRERLIFFSVIAIIGYVLPMTATLYAAPYVPAGILSLMASLTPLFTFATALIFRTEAISKLRMAAVCLGCVSIAMVLAPQLQLPGSGTLWWLILALLIPLCYGVESIYVAANWPAGLDVIQMVFAEVLAGAIFTVPLLVMFGEPRTLILQGTMAELAIVVFVLCGVFEVYMYFYLVRTTGGVLVSFASFVSLFAGIGWGILIFSESHAISVWLAVFILCAALALVTIDHVKRGA